MRFENVLICIFDGQVDRQGEIIEPNYNLPNLTVPVTMEFDTGRTVGVASNFILANNRLYTTLELDLARVNPEHLRHLSAGIGGVVNHREGIRVTEWTLTDIALVRDPVDPRLPRVISEPSYYEEVNATTIRLDQPLRMDDAMRAFDDFFEEKKPMKKEKKKKRPRYADWEFA